MSDQTVSILHLGLGRFHRAHQAVYYQKLRDAGDAQWGGVSLSMRSPEARDQLQSVNHRYPVVELSETGSKLIWVDVIQEALDAQSDFEKVLTWFCDPRIKIISLTVTEKGYCLNSDGSLDLNHAKIQTDLAKPLNPKTSIGILALGLKLRFDLDLEGVTILSCDNLRENGTKLKKALSSYLEKLGWSETLEDLASKTTFPNTMVDRIVPALSPEKTQEFESRLNLPANSQLVATEVFSQWVIENNFINGRPDWESVGVEFVTDVRPYEEMKLRLLNAAHSFLAYAGLLKGYCFVHEAIADDELKILVEKLILEEVIPVLEIPVGFDARDYGRRLLQRFRNNELPHQLQQIAMDGSQKLPQRILPSLVEAHRKKSSHETLVVAVASWLKFVWKTLEEGQRLDDPMGDQLDFVSRQDKEVWTKQVLESQVFASLADVPELKGVIVAAVCSQ